MKSKPLNANAGKTKAVESKTAETITRVRWEALSECALLGVRKTARTLTQRYEAHLKPTGLRAAQFSALAMLLGRSRLSMGQLAKWLVADRTTLTRVLKPLRNRGLVSVQPGKDARVHEVSITPEGKALMEKALPYWEAAQGEVSEALGAARLQDLLGGMASLRSFEGEPRQDVPDEG